MDDNIIKQAMARRLRDGDDAVHIAEVVIAALRLLHAELALLIGGQASSALFAHALHRTRQNLNWTKLPAAAQFDQMLGTLGDDMKARSPVQALFAGETLLFALIEHLIFLIGEPVTQRMLLSAWNTPDADQISKKDYQ